MTFLSLVSVTLTIQTCRGHIPAVVSGVLSRTDLCSVGVVLPVDSAACVIGFDRGDGSRWDLCCRGGLVHHSQHLHDGNGNCRTEKTHADAWSVRQL